MYARQEISNNRNFALLPYENTICVILPGLEHLKVFVAITLYRDERQKKIIIFQKSILSDDRNEKIFPCNFRAVQNYEVNKYIAECFYSSIFYPRKQKG